MTIVDLLDKHLAEIIAVAIVFIIAWMMRD